MVMRLMAAASAASEPEIQAKKPQPSTVAVPDPAFCQPIAASATCSSFNDRPVRTSTSPVRIKSGTAIRANESTPSNSASPRSVSGKTSVKWSMANDPSPITTHILTPRRIITTMPISGP